MKKSTAELLLGIKAAARHGETCVIGQAAVNEVATDGIALTIVDRKKVTRGGLETVECVIRCDVAPDCFNLAAQTLQEYEEDEAANLSEVATLQDAESSDVTHAETTMLDTTVPAA